MIKEGKGPKSVGLKVPESTTGSMDPRLSVLLAEYREREADKRLVMQAIFAIIGVLVAAVVLSTNASRDSESLPFALLSPLMLGATWLVLVIRAFTIRIVLRSSKIEKELSGYLPDQSSFEAEFIERVNKSDEAFHSVRYFAYLGWAGGTSLALLGGLAILNSKVLATLGTNVPQVMTVGYWIWTAAALGLGVGAWRKTSKDLSANGTRHRKAARKRTRRRIVPFGIWAAIGRRPSRAEGPRAARHR